MKIKDIVKKHNLSVVQHLLYRWIRPTVSLKLSGGNYIVPLGGTGSLPLLNWRESWKTYLIRHLMSKKEGKFIDVGANVGQTLLDFFAACPNSIENYIGFEPNPVCVANLEEFRRVNHLKECFVIPVGLSDCTTILPIYLGLNNSVDVSGTIIENLRSLQNEKMLVPFYRFDELWKKIGAFEISMIKVDVEGAEFQVLKGMQDSIMKFRPYIVCEVLHASKMANLAEYSERIGLLFNLLKEYGYIVFRIERNSDDGFNGFKLVDSFPIKHWDDVSDKECDYLFSPKEYLAILKCE